MKDAFVDLIRMLELREKRQLAALEETRSQLEGARKAAGVPVQAEIPAPKGR